MQPPPPPPEMTRGFLIQLVFCKKKSYVVSSGHQSVTPFLSGAPLLKEILDPPLIIQKVKNQDRLPCELTNTMVVVSKPSKIRIHLDPRDLLTVQGDSGTQIPDDDSR